MAHPWPCQEFLGSGEPLFVITGIEWLIDAAGCQVEPLRNAALLARLCNQLLSDLELRCVGDGMWHTFPAPGGVTGLYLLTESHLACHTYPEWQTATFNLYCCRERPVWNWSDALEKHLRAEHVAVRRFERGVEPTSPPAAASPHWTTALNRPSQPTPRAVP